MPLRAVFLDIGETLVDETRMWGAWADALEVPALTLFALLGAAIARGEHHRSVFDHFSPGRLARARGRMRSVEPLVPGDLYPDAVPCLSALRDRGLRVGIGGNQPAAIEAALVAVGVPADVIGSSERWGVEKPAPEFFRRLVAETGVPAEEVLHVGDRLDNDVLPALREGLQAALIRRGPWGLLHAARTAAPVRVLESLMEVPELVDQLR
ncbi:MAG TPA: HAD family hydrolase [Myxococcaceae bacterium]